MQTHSDYQTVLDFWFIELSPEHWWKKDTALDEKIERQFKSLHRQAQLGELSGWRECAEGALAEIIVLDQFSRNIYRDTPEAFASDNVALVLAQCAIANGYDKVLPNQWLSFLYMPFMHSESLVIHEHAVHLFEQLGNASNLDFELQHKKIIERFGRYPHRNAILGRASTDEELAFLTEPGSSF